jgi:hypothetical protein
MLEQDDDGADEEEDDDHSEKDPVRIPKPIELFSNEKCIGP